MVLGRHISCGGDTNQPNTLLSSPRELPLFLGRSWDQPDLKILPDPRKLSDLSISVPSRYHLLARDPSQPRHRFPAVMPTPPVGPLPAAGAVPPKSPPDPVPPPLGPQWLPRAGNSPYCGQEGLPGLPSDHPATLTHRAHPLRGQFGPHHPTTQQESCTPVFLPGCLKISPECHLL